MRRRHGYPPPMLAAFAFTATLLAPPEMIGTAAGLVHAAAVAPGVHLAVGARAQG